VNVVNVVQGFFSLSRTPIAKCGLASD